VCVLTCRCQSGRVVDLAAVENGGKAVGCSDAHFGHPKNLINPGRWASRVSPYVWRACVTVRHANHVRDGGCSDASSDTPRTGCFGGAYKNTETTDGERSRSDWRRCVRRGINMGDGWETARKLTRPAVLEPDDQGLIKVMDTLKILD
jgi:hypothetical protein